MTPPMAERIAKRAADRLFTNGLGQTAQRMQLMQRVSGGKCGGTERDIGGWCRDAVERQITDAIREELTANPEAGID